MSNHLDESLLDKDIHQNYQSLCLFSPVGSMKTMRSPDKIFKREGSAKSIRSIASMNSALAENPMIISHKGKLTVIPDGGYGWVIVCSGFFVQFLVLGLSSSFGILLPVYIKEFNSDAGKVAWVGSISGGTIDLLAALSGQLSDRFGNRIIVMLGALIIFIGLMVSSIATDLWQLYITQGLLVGVGFSLAFISGVSVVGQWFTTKRGLATGITLSGAGVGQIVLAVATNTLVKNFGWRLALKYLAIFISCGLIVCASAIVRLFPLDSTPKESSSILNTLLNQMKSIFYNENTKECKPQPYQANELKYTSKDVENREIAEMSSEQSSISTDETREKLIENKNFLLLYCTIFTASLGLTMPSAHLMNYAILHGIDVDNAAMLVSAMGVGSALGRLGIGYAADRMNNIVIMRCCLFSVGAVTLAWIALQQMYQLILYALLFGLCSGGFYSLIPSVAAEIFGVRKLGELLGALYTACCVGDFVAAPIGGFLLAATGNYTPAILFAALIMLSSVFFAFAIAVETVDKHQVKYTPSDEQSDAIATSSSRQEKLRGIRSRSRSVEDVFSKSMSPDKIFQSTSNEVHATLDLVPFGELHNFSSRGMWNPSSRGITSPWRLEDLPVMDASSFKLGSYEDGGAFKYGISLR